MATIICKKRMVKRQHLAKAHNKWWVSEYI